MNDEDIRSLGEKGNPDYYTNPAEEAYRVKYIGEDKAVVQLKKEDEMHWSKKREMGYKAQPREEWELGDEMADHSDDQGWDIENEPEEADCERN